MTDHATLMTARQCSYRLLMQAFSAFLLFNRPKFPLNKLLPANLNVSAFRHLVGAAVLQRLLVNEKLQLHPVTQKSNNLGRPLCLLGSNLLRERERESKP